MNDLKLGGTLGRCYIGDSPDGKYAFFAVKPDGKKFFIDCKANGDVAESLVGASEGATIRVSGELGPSKDKKTQQWKTIVYATSIEVEGDAF